MIRKVALEPEAEADIDSEFYFIAEDNLSAALRFLSAAEQTCEKIAEMPGSSSLRQFNNPVLAGLRMRPIDGFANYLAFYLTTENSILVLRELHGARDIVKIFDPNA